MLKVSVVTPYYNYSKYLADCVESVKQSISLDKFVLEHIVVDDGSSEDYRVALEKLESPNLKKIYLPRNVGPAQARNEAIAKSDADYFFTLDSDDMLSRNGLRYLLDSLKNKSWAYGDYLAVDGERKYLLGKDYCGWYYENAIELIIALLTKKHFFPPTLMFSRDIFDRVSGFDPDLRRHELADFAVKILLMNENPVYVPTVTILRRYHDQNVSLDLITDPTKANDNLLNLFEKYSSQLQNFLPLSKYEEIKKFVNSQ